MVGATDTQVYSTQYTTYDISKRNHVQKTLVIPGKAGYKISIDKLSYYLNAASLGNSALACVTIEVGGVEKELWEEEEEPSKTPTKKEFNPGYVAPVGATVTLRWHLRTSKYPYKAYLTQVYSLYSYRGLEVPVVEEPVEAEPTEDNVPCAIWITCKNGDDANLLIDDLKAHVGDREIGIYLKQ